MIWRALLLAIVIIGCGPSVKDDGRLDAVMVVMCADPDPEEPHIPCCTGFVLEGQVVTANHCVPDDTAELVTHRQWVDTSNASEIGTVLARDTARDIAWLSAALDGPELVRGAAVAEGDAVSALTRSAVQSGIAGPLSGIFWQSTMNTQLGDSGAAIVDRAGHAVGVLTDCLTPFDAPQACRPNTAIFSELP